MRPKFSVTFEEALIIVDHLVFAKKSRHLSEAEIIVLKGAWNDLDYEQIAQNTRFSLNYLQRTVAPKLWDILSETMGNDTPVGKKRLRCFLEEITKKHYDQSATNAKQRPSVKEVLQIKGDQPPDVTSFFGRTEELTYLKDLTIKQRCIVLTGVAGIGKSALAAKLLASVSVESQPSFDCLIWKSIAHAPLLPDLVSELIELIQPKESLPEYTQAKISVLLKQMQSHRCLLVLDADDALFQRRRYNLEQRLEYEIFFRRLTEERHTSCLLLTSRVLPREIEVLIEAKRSIQYLKIEGLDSDAARQILLSYGLTDQEKCDELIKTYWGNPSELEALANRIQRFFGSTEKFFENKTTLVSIQLQEMLNQMFGQHLSEIQRQIMVYLAQEIDSNSKFIGFNQLLSHLNQNWTTSVSTSALITALEELEKESLIEIIKDPTTKEISFELQPPIKKYILTDPLGLVRAIRVSGNQNVGEQLDHTRISTTFVQPVYPK